MQLKHPFQQALPIVAWTSKHVHTQAKSRVQQEAGQEGYP